MVKGDYVQRPRSRKGEEGREGFQREVGGGWLWRRLGEESRMEVPVVKGRSKGWRGGGAGAMPGEAARGQRKGSAGGVRWGQR